jgi:TPP-dependent pyruvate/acetoin dehydrogenase alpha subunit
MTEPIDAATAERLYRSIHRIRRVEEEIARLYPTDRIKSPVHLSIGQEAVSAGVCDALEPRDVVFGTYRSHALYLAKGGDLKGMMAELYGKVTGCARGKGGSMHLIDAAHGVMGASAVVASTIPQAVGYAFAQKLRGTGGLVASFFGDGAVEEGVFHESMQFAALRRLPILFVCENNGYAIHSPLAERQPAGAIWERARSYGLPAERVEDDVIALHARARERVTAIRAGTGPAFLECMTYRWREHVGPGEDFHLGYRSRAEAQPWIERDARRRLGTLLAPAVRARAEAEIEAEIADAVRFAEESPFPPAEELHADLYRGAVRAR